jgi:hypothetical protein
MLLWNTIYVQYWSATVMCCGKSNLDLQSCLIRYRAVVDAAQLVDVQYADAATCNTLLVLRCSSEGW